MKEGFLLSGSYNKKICIWDLKAGNRAPVLDAQQVFEVAVKASSWLRASTTSSSCTAIAVARLMATGCSTHGRQARCPRSRSFSAAGEPEMRHQRGGHNIRKASSYERKAPYLDSHWAAYLLLWCSSSQCEWLFVGQDLRRQANGHHLEPSARNLHQRQETQGPL
ncbi:uncharacterized protein LOC125544089 [Triticum urartu]|uniref:uncharacterized protein LOC125544089 n=1 Tax=Triticum urartu TaxID=4572 RepID=UPI0020439A2C|nr:uncharacterized protein LOC125544089 [Triticum urartu]XP_048563609.1 uncharacterized protein LOC125544089 [Triticum urartu]XP_048563610.1 uncharacterized protein LOC125544089 [Triticum urartu]